MRTVKAFRLLMKVYRGDGLPGLRDLGHARRVERRANRP